MTSERFLEILHQSMINLSGENPGLKLSRDLRICERSICFRIGHLLAMKVEPEFFVDSEYNLDLSVDERKSLPNTGKTGRVFPDLIVHKRTPNKEENFAVIEVKFLNDTVGIADAKVRIKKFRDKYGYKFGAVIAIPNSHEKFADLYEIEPC